MHAFECALDEIAQLIDMDPIDLRLHNAADEGTQASYGPKFPPIGFQSLFASGQGPPKLPGTGA